MGEAAIRAARAAGYYNAGTVEFLVDSARNFYFLEMNTRLQVEHPVTELVTGLDLVKLQLHIAAGHPLELAQEDITWRGAAIECRVYAEDPSSGFLPQAGPLALYREPDGPGIRIDSGVEEGTAVPVQYDPMLAKLIASGETRDAAIARAVAALRQFPILGVRTNVAFLIRTLEHPAFRAGDLHTGFVDEHLPSLLEKTEPSELVLSVARAAQSSRDVGPSAATGATMAAVDPWSRLEGWGR